MVAKLDIVAVFLQDSGVTFFQSFFDEKTRPYTLPLSRGRVGRSRIVKKRSQFVLVTDRPTDTAR